MYSKEAIKSITKRNQEVNFIALHKKLKQTKDELM